MPPVEPANSLIESPSTLASLHPLDSLSSLSSLLSALTSSYSALFSTGESPAGSE